MNIRIGLGIGSDACRAVLMRGSTVVREEEESLVAGESIAALVVRLLARMPLPRMARPHAIAAIGSAAAQMRRVTGLPAGVTDSRVLSAALRTNEHRFFVTSGAATWRTALHNDGRRWWGAVYDESIVRDVSAACRRARVRLDGFIPAAWAIAGSLGDGQYRWRDGNVVLELVVGGGSLVRVRRRRADAATHEVDRAIDLPATIELPRFADAVGAAAASRRAALLLPAQDGLERSRRPTRHALATAATVSAVAWLAGPGIVATRARAHAEQRVAALRGSADEVTRATNDLRIATAALSDVAHFRNSRRSILLLLGELARMLPESTAIVTLRADSVGGTFVVLSTSAASVLARLRPGSFETPQLAGAIAPAVVDGDTLQRLSLQFRFSPGPQRE